MKILTASQMHQADEASFKRLSIQSRTVVEAAGRAVGEWVAETLPAEANRGVAVLTGPGNNGADGLVAARALASIGFQVSAYTVVPKSALKGDCALCAESFVQSGGELRELDVANLSQLNSLISSEQVLIDAMFGTGTSRPLEGTAAAAAAAINRPTRKITIVSLDVPSGISTDNKNIFNGVCADFTIAIQALKPCHVMLPGAAMCGEVHVVDVGIRSDWASSSLELLERHQIADQLRRHYNLSDSAHKGSRGHVVLIGGAAGHVGAIKLSGYAALRAGSGLVTVCLPESYAETAAAELFELMCHALPDDGSGNFTSAGDNDISSLLQKKQAAVIGPGLGQTEGAVALLLQLINAAKASDIRLVLDADALNILAARESLPQLGSGVVLTPHPGEMARLLKASIKEVEADRTAAAQSLVEQTKAVVVLKGARTVICAEGEGCFIVPYANQILGTGGSGDVLAGFVGSLLGRGFPSLTAACCAAFIHGEGGEILFHEQGGPAGTTASDISNAIPRALNELLLCPDPVPSFRRKALNAFLLTV